MIYRIIAYKFIRISCNTQYFMINFWGQASGKQSIIQFQEDRYFHGYVNICRNRYLKIVNFENKLLYVASYVAIVNRILYDIEH